MLQARERQKGVCLFEFVCVNMALQCCPDIFSQAVLTHFHTLNHVILSSQLTCDLSESQYANNHAEVKCQGVHISQSELKGNLVLLDITVIYLICLSYISTVKIC